MGGGVFTTTRVSAFADNLDTCGLLDIEYFGSNFTWMGHYRGGKRVARKLDKGVRDLSWRMAFPKATIEHLVHRHSDHNPLFLRCGNNVSTREGRPFRFQAAWCTHDDYKTVVQNAWEKDCDNIHSALLNVCEDSIIFNKEVFGNLFANKKKLVARLQAFNRLKSVWTQLP